VTAKRLRRPGRRNQPNKGMLINALRRHPLVFRKRRFFGERLRIALSAARVVAPVATPSSTTITTRSLGSTRGNFRNGGSDYRPKGEPQRVNVHDFADKELASEETEFNAMRLPADSDLNIQGAGPTVGAAFAEAALAMTAAVTDPAAIRHEETIEIECAGKGK